MVTLSNVDLKVCSEIGKCAMFLNFYQNEIRVEGKPVDKTQSERRDLNFFQMSPVFLSLRSENWASLVRPGLNTTSLVFMLCIKRFNRFPDIFCRNGHTSCFKRCDLLKM